MIAAKGRALSGVEAWGRGLYRIGNAFHRQRPGYVSPLNGVVPVNPQSSGEALRCLQEYGPNRVHA